MYIGIDLGGTNIAGAVVSREGTISSRKSIPTHADRPSHLLMKDIAALIEDLKISAASEIKAVGIGIPGIANPDTGEVISCVNLNWRNVPLRETIEKAVGIPVFIDNDATVAAVAELEIAQKGRYQNAAVITLGTGVGCGLMIGGKVHAGAHGIGAEIGHMKVGEPLYRCNCGGWGCLETFSSATAIIRYATYLIEEEEKESVLKPYVLKNTLNGELIFKAAQEGDEVARLTVERLMLYLGKGIMNLVCLIDPEIIFLGGGLAHAGEYLIEGLKASTDGEKYFPEMPYAQLALAELKNDAGIIGAAMYAALQFDEK